MDEYKWNCFFHKCTSELVDSQIYIVLLSEKSELLALNIESELFSIEFK